MAKPLCVIAEAEEIFRKALINLLREEWPDLDIRMPGLTSLEVAAAMSEDSPRIQIVFVTAYDQYAVDAFEKGAVDYLLEPIVSERLAGTIQRRKLRAAGHNDT